MSDCPKCGGNVVYAGLNDIECQGWTAGNKACENNPKSDWQDHLRHLVKIAAGMTLEPHKYTKSFL